MAEKRKMPRPCEVCGDEMLLDYEVNEKEPWRPPEGLRTTCEPCEKIIAENPLAAWMIKVAQKAASDARRGHEDDNRHYEIR